MGKYEIALGSIKTKLSRFTHQSVLAVALNYLSEKSDNKINDLKRAPWVVMFAIKLSLLESEGALLISERDFLNIVNELYEMQVLAINFKAENIQLAMRTMMIQQSWYQIGTADKFVSLYRQSLLLGQGHEYYAREFKSKVGVGLDNFYKITLYLMLQTSTNKVKNFFELNVLDLIYRLCPAIPLDELACYLYSVGMRVVEMPAFMEQFRLVDSPVSEYFQQTPIRHKPILISGDSFYLFNTSISMAGLSDFVPVFLKRHTKYKNYFGADMENYIGRLLRDSGLEVVREEAIRKIYSEASVKGKVVDYLIFDEDGGITFIECKALDPSDQVKCHSDPALLLASLPDKFISAIGQGVECASILSKLVRFSTRKFKMLVVTLDEFWIYGGKYISENIDKDLQRNLVDKYGDLILPLDRIIYMALGDFERLLRGQQEGVISLSSFLDDCISGQDDPVRSRMTAGQHVSEKVAYGLRDSSEIMVEADRQTAAMQAVLIQNKEFWSGRAMELMQTHSQFLKILDRAFNLGVESST